jgi:hypothetical protein
VNNHKKLFDQDHEDNNKNKISTFRNGVELATLFDQNHVDNHKNSMVGQSVLAELEQGDRIQVK